MGYFFTLLYLLTAYLTPAVLFGPLSDFHIEIIVIVLAIVFSLPNLSESGLSRAPQALALAGILFSIIASIVQTGWLGGIFGPIYGFMQPLFAFFLVAINCKTRRHLQWIILLFVLGSFLFMVQGISDLRADVSPSPYLYGDTNLRRLRGLGFVNDPNDFSQVLVSLIPAVFLWRQKSVFLNFFLVGIPIVLLIVGMYFTHSRGAMLALMVVVLFSARRKIGAVPAAIVSGGLLAGLFAVGWSGGRDVSMDAGADRLDLWYDGMEAIKAHPLFGIGINRFMEVYGITAHNSVVICASELGVIGLFFWVFFVFSTVRQTLYTARQAEVTSPDDLADARLITQDKAQPDSAGILALNPPWVEKQFPAPGIPDGQQVDQDPKAIARILFLSLAGLLTAGWFLSRALSIWLFMYCGMVYAVSRMSPEARTNPEDTPSFLARWSVAITFALLLCLYGILRSRNL